MAKRSGRPPKPPDEVKSARLEIRLTAAEKEAYEQAAKSSGLEVSDWIRAKLNTAAKRTSRTP